MTYKCGNCKDDEDFEPCILTIPLLPAGATPDLCPLDKKMHADWKRIEEPTP